MDEKSAREQALEEAVLVLLDQVDYSAGACRPSEPVAGVLPTVLIKRARRALGLTAMLTEQWRNEPPQAVGFYWFASHESGLSVIEVWKEDQAQGGERYFYREIGETSSHPLDPRLKYACWFGPSLEPPPLPSAYVTHRARTTGRFDYMTKEERENGKE